MKSRLSVLVLAALALLGTAGCEWTSGGGVDDWNSRYNWVNFSGVYKGVGGGVLVTDYSATPGTAGVTNSVTDETIAIAAAGVSAYSGSLDHKSIVKGSVTITAGVFTLTDTGGTGVLSGSGKSGTIDYGTGAWSIDLLGVWPDDGTAITASYQYSIAGNQGSGSAEPGSSGTTIYSFTVMHEGETLSITDNNGKVYTGKMGSVRSTGGADQDNQATPVAGDTIIAQFSATGVSAAGYSVEIVGTFQGTVTAGGSTGFSLANRTMFGTWIEDGGTTGDVNGQASPIPITVSGGSATNSKWTVSASTTD